MLKAPIQMLGKLARCNKCLNPVKVTLEKEPTIQEERKKIDTGEISDLEIMMWVIAFFLVFVLFFFILSIDKKTAFQITLSLKKLKKEYLPSFSFFVFLFGFFIFAIVMYLLPHNKNIYQWRTSTEKSKGKPTPSPSNSESMNDGFDVKVREVLEKVLKTDDVTSYTQPFFLLILVLCVLFALISPKQIKFREVSKNTIEMRVPSGTSRQKAIKAMLTKIYYYAQSNPDQSILRVKWVMPKEGLVDGYGNPLKEDIQMGIFKNWHFNKLTEVRKYQSLTDFLRTITQSPGSKILDEHISGLFDGAHLLGD